MKIVNFEFKSTHSDVTIRVPNSAAATIYPHSGLKKIQKEKKLRKKDAKEKKGGKEKKDAKKIRSL